MSPQTSSSISYMRFVALVCILLHHSFCVYSGWPPNLNVSSGLPESFQVISSACKGIGLIAFCFISGMLVSYSFDKINKNSNVHKNWIRFILKKFKRLIVPAITWGIIYAVFFNDYMIEYSPQFINGTHLWFLPMLFLLMLVVSPVMYNKYLWIIPPVIFCCFFLHSYSRTTNEFVIYFPSFVCGYFFSVLECKGQRCGSFRKLIYILPIAGCILMYLMLSLYYSTLFSYAIYLIVVIGLIITFKHFSKAISSFFELSPIKFATKESFTIYIIHQFVIILFSFLNIAFLSTASAASVIIYFIVTFSGSSAIAYIFSLLKEKYKLIEYVF